MLKINKLSFKYKDKQIFDNLSFTFPSKSFNVLIGKNGTGKTTLLKLISSLYEEAEGQITWKNMDVHNLKIKSQISYAPSDIDLYSNIKVIDFFNYVIGFICEKSKGIKELNKIIKLFRVKEIINKKIKHLSLGEIKKVILIQALLKKASLYIFDEPLANLEPDSREVLLKELLKRKKAGATIILTTHNLLDVKNYVNNAFVLGTNFKIKFIANPKDLISIYKNGAR